MIAFTLKMHAKELRESIVMFIAWRLPKDLVTWAAIRLIAHATQNAYGDTVVPELTAMDAVDRWMKTA